MKRALVAIFIAMTFSFSAYGFVRADPFDYFEGQWLCKSDAGSQSYMLFHTVLNRRWLVLENTWVHPAGPKGEFIEYYRHDPTGTWWVSSLGDDESLFVGISPDWKDDQLVFEGTINFPSGTFKTRELYVRWKDGSLERQHQQIARGGWLTYSRSVCRRVTPQS